MPLAEPIEPRLLKRTVLSEKMTTLFALWMIS